MSPPVYIPRFTVSILTRSVLIWGFVRVLVTVGTRAAESALRIPPSDPLRLTSWAAIGVVVIVGVMGWVSARRRNEDVFLLCLGCGRRLQTAMFAGPAALLEAAIMIATWP